MRRTTRSLIAAAILALGSAAAIGAQAPAAAGWRIQLDPFTDLWFHGIALAGVSTGDGLPLYDPGYAARLSTIRARLGVHTRLDDELPPLRRALATDSALEVLHFIPLFFAGEDPSIVLATIRAAASGRSAPASASPRIAAAATAIVAALPEPAQRETLAAFAAALEQEWREFYRGYHATLAADAAPTIARLQQHWDLRFATPLTPYLRDARIGRGTILLSPALGADGRMRAVPGTSSSVVAVAFARDAAERDASLFFAVRELSYPLVHEAESLAPALVASDGASADARSGRAAVRAGAMLLESGAPALAAGYRIVFLTAAGVNAAADPAGEFAAAYPIPPALERALQRSLPVPVPAPSATSSMQTP
jgi:hypothetical protein